MTPQWPPVATLLPHAGAMVLVDAIVDCDARRIVCASACHRDPHNPLRMNGHLPTLCGIEIAAQAMALHGALSRDPPRALRFGRLAAIHDVAVLHPALDAFAAPLAIECILEGSSGDARGYGFRITSDGTALLAGRATVVMSDRDPA
ncbi:MAG TPA: hydroxymyristoyl-ACP dehydratase [Casimicrobiaceae bacterium]|jgi:predicted hotdog family 3-hydroxylacyl-ACP dehydratase|nr:hydroxymyristoyl-ACP dehydratase [Casimicrobiaceae bacterium]